MMQIEKKLKITAS